MPTAAPPFAVVPALTTPPPMGPTFDASLHLPVTNLSPTTTTLRSHIEANVALVWPYSNSTATFALLLIDHTSRGQVKVVFRAGCAKQVAKTKVGIGDKIKLALLGCQWNETVDIISTPGKRLEWDLVYHSRLILQIHPQGQNVISLDYTDLSEPVLRSSDSVIQPPLNGIAHRKPSTIQVPYLTPSTPNRKSSDGTFFDSSLASLTDDDDDGYVVGRGRKRTKFARHSGAWNLIDNEIEAAPDTSSPRTSKDQGRISESSGATGQTIEANPSAVQQQVDDRRNELDSTILITSDRQASRLESGAGIQSPSRIRLACSDLKQELYEHGPVNAASDPDLAQTSLVLSTTEPDTNAALRGTAVMGPPSTPFRQLRPPQHPEGESSGVSDGDVDRASTPRILPLASPGLPLVSPLIQRGGVEVGYFPIFQESLSQLDASGQNNPDESAADTLLEISDKESTNSDESVVIVEERVSESLEPVEMQKSDPPSLPSVPSFDYSFQANGAQKTYETEPSLLPDQWLSTLEASIAQELSNNDQSSPIDIELERTVLMTENHSDSIYNAPIAMIPNKQTTSLSGLETEDLYGAPEDELVKTPQPRSQIGETENENLLTQTQEVQLEIDASEMLSPNRQGDIAPVDVVEQFVHSPLVIEAAGPNTAATASDFIPLGLQDQDERTIWTDSFDGNVDSRENFHENQINIGSKTGTATLDRRRVIDVEDRAQGPLVAVEHSGLAVAAGSDVDHADKDPVLMSNKGGQEAVPSSVQLHVAQLKAGADNTQLPTPDQTQKETSAMDHDHDHEDVQLEELVALPSPRPSQETLPIVALGNERDKEQSQESRSEALQTSIQSEPKVVAPPRSSQRLSSRSVAMSKGISSPYFTARRSARFSTSPSREENIPPSSPQMSTFLSSPNPNTEHREKSTDEKAGLTQSPVLPSGELMARLENGLITPLAYYTGLSSLHEHFGQLQDIIAVCSTSSTKAERAKSGPKDYHTSLHLVDPSCGPNHIPSVLAQVFRPVKKALPVAQAGDVVVLHNFKVHTTKRNFALLSSDTSSWAVISCSSNSSEVEVVTSGPPLEQGSAEAAYASSLYRWWDGKQGTTTLNDTDEIPDKERAARESSTGPATRTRLRVKSSPIQSSKALPSKGRRRATLMDNIEILGDQRPISDNDQSEEAEQIRRSTVSPPQSSKPLSAARRRRANLTDNASNEGDQGQVFDDSDVDDTSSPLADRTNKRRESTISTAPSTTTQNQGKEITPRRSARTGRSPSVVHELRDGTKYVDDQGPHGNSVVHELRDGVTYIDE